MAAGLSCFTHLFNAMRPLESREPGPIAAALLAGGEGVVMGTALGCLAGALVGGASLDAREFAQIVAAATR